MLLSLFIEKDALKKVMVLVANCIFVTYVTFSFIYFDIVPSTSFDREFMVGGTEMYHVAITVFWQCDKIAF